MPTKEHVFADKGHTWVYWLELGRPYKARMYSISDPWEEEKALTTKATKKVSRKKDPAEQLSFEVLDGGVGE